MFYTFLTKLLNIFNRFIDYHDAVNNTDTKCDSSDVPHDLKKKASLLSYFSRYMETYLSSERQTQTEINNNITSSSDAEAVAVKKWYRTKDAVAMYLSNGALQVSLLHYNKKKLIGELHYNKK